MPDEPEPLDPDADRGAFGHTADEKDVELAAARADGGVCDDRHLAELESAIVAAPTPAPAQGPHATWDHRATPAHAVEVRAALALTAAENVQLARDGFVVPARLAYDNFAQPYYDIHRAQLPVFVTVDSILESVYIAHDELFGKLESELLVKRLDATLGAMHCGLAAAAASYPPDTARDLDVYLTVARSLLAAQTVPPELGEATAALAQPIVDLVQEAGPLTTIELFGRTRSFDASQYAPRGHYETDETLARYFRAAMWLSRVELNLVSRDSRSSQPGYQPDPSQTPREDVAALALADLAQRSGALADLEALDHAWAVFAGRREDVTIAQLGELRTAAGITSLTAPDAADRLRVAIGDKFPRTVNVSPMPNVANLPAIATLLGARITPDTVAVGKLVDGRGPDLHAAELAFMVGQDRALHYLDPTLAPRLREARATLAHAPLGDDLYSAWLTAIRSLGERPRGAMPAFMDTDKFADLRLDSALAAYGELRHNHVLIAAQAYDQGGCEIPDGYVEPAIETYRALAEYAARGRGVFAQLDPEDASGGASYFARLEKLMRVFVAISATELANQPLSETAKRFLSMIVEQREATGQGYNGPFPIAVYDGWYIDLFPAIDAAFHDASFIADYATYNRNGETGIHYLGAHGPALGVFVVDAGGAPRMMVGPVAHAYEYRGPLDHRLGDRDARDVAGLAPWAAGYTVAAAAPPDLQFDFARPTPAPQVGTPPVRPTRRRRDPATENTMHFSTKRALDVTVELLDHHFVKLATVTLHLEQGENLVKAPATKAPVESFRFRIGDFIDRVDLRLDGTGYRQWGES